MFSAALAFLRPLLLPLILGGSALAMGWLWLDEREDSAVEMDRLKTTVASLNLQIETTAKEAEKAREASRDYQTRLSAVQSDAAALREHNRGLQIIAYRRIPAVSIAPTRLIDASTVIERDSGTEIDLGRLERLATNCQADAEQLSALIGWVNR